MFSRTLVTASLLISALFLSSQSFAEACKTTGNALKFVDYRVMLVSGSGERKWFNILSKNIDTYKERDKNYFNYGADFVINLKKVSRKGSFKSTGIKRAFIISKKKVDRTVFSLAQVSSAKDPFVKVTDVDVPKGERLKLNVNIPKGKRKGLTRLLVTTQHACERNKAGKLVVLK